MATSSEQRYIHRRTSGVPVVLAVVVLGGVSVPGLVMRPSPLTVCVLVVASACVAAIVRLWRNGIECSHDASARTLRLVRQRWPRSPIVRTIAVDSIERIETHREGTTVWTTIVLREGAPEVLPGGGRETGDVLRGWLGD